MTLGQGLVIERVVHHKIERGAQVGNVTTESLVRVNGYFVAVEVHTVVGLEEFLHVGVFVTLHLFRGEPLRLEILESLVANSIHRLSGVAENHLPRLLVEFYILLLTIHN